MSVSSTDAPISFSVPPSRLLLFPFSEDGTPLGNTNLILDYSGAGASEAWVAGPPGFHWHIKTMDFYIQGAGNITANGYGPILALVNGLGIQVRNADDTLVLPPLTVRTTGEFSSIPGTTLGTFSDGPGDNYLNVQWDFQAASGSPVVLGVGMKLLATLADSFLGLTAHRMTAAGFLVPAPT